MPMLSDHHLLNGRLGVRTQPGGPASNEEQWKETHVGGEVQTTVCLSIYTPDHNVTTVLRGCQEAR